MISEITNRGFLFGDGFFETIRVVNGQIPLAQYHLKRIKKGLEIFGFQASFLLDEKFIKDVINIKENPNCICRISFYRDGVGQYTPESNNVLFHLNYRKSEITFQIPYDFDLQYFINSLPVNEKTFSISNTPKPNHPVFSVKTLSSAIYVMYANEKKESKSDLIFLKNTAGNILEELSHNYLLRKSNELFSPKLDSGLVQGVVLQFLMDNYGFLIQEKEITNEDLLESDELILLNGANGLIRVMLSNGPLNKE
jgi:branched-subunit amino acid aminotransferase/4-amino-4-deoxychorismate lyase